MNKPLTRHFDLCSGHGCFPPRKNITASANVYTNSLGNHRQTDRWAVHCCGRRCHDGFTAAGSPTVYTNSLQQARLGDPVNCGSKCLQGSPNTYVGESGGQIGGSLDLRVLDDVPEDDDGLAIYPPIGTGGTPTPQQIFESQQFGVDPAEQPPVPIEVQSNPTTNNIPGTVIDCSSLPDMMSYPDSLVLSTNFQLGDVSTRAVLSRTAVVAQHSLTAKQIVCNLKALCENVLENVIQLYGNNGLIITSGFRQGSGPSQHERGQAVDIQFRNITKEEYWNRAQHVIKNVPFDQFILEYGGNMPWFHMSFSNTQRRGQVLTRIKPGVYRPGLQRIF